MNMTRLLLASSMLALLPACASPTTPPPGGGETTTGQTTAEVTASWKPVSGTTLVALAAASTGNEGAVAYAELAGAGEDGVRTTVFKLQRLDAAGAVRGPAVELGSIHSNDSGSLTLATDGDAYLACWGYEDQIACATAPVGEGPASAALSVAGVGPALAYGSGTFALAYALPGQLAVTRVASDGSAVGAPAMFDAPASDDVPGRALLAASKDGFVLAGGENVRVQALDSAFSPVAPPVDLGVTLWFFAALATSGSDTVISLSKPYGGHLFVVEGGAVTSSRELDGGGKSGLNAAVAVDGDGYGFLSADDLGGLHYSTIVEGALIESKETLASEYGNYDGRDLALLRMQGEMFLVATPGYEGEILVARMHRP